MLGLIIKTGHENDWNLGPASLQMISQFNSRCASKPNVQHKTINSRNDPAR